MPTMTQTTSTEPAQVTTFKRKLRNLESAFRRLDRGELTGRNADASDRTRWMQYEHLRTLAGSDAVADALDADSNLAARWSRMERRSVGLQA